MDTLPVISLVISVLGLAAVYFGFVGKINDKIDKLSERVTKAETNNEIFWKVLEPHMAAIIHSPVHKDRDELVDKLVNNTITIVEADTLTCLLEKNISDNNDSTKKLASAFFLARVKSLVATGSIHK